MRARWLLLLVTSASLLLLSPGGAAAGWYCTGQQLWTPAKVSIHTPRLAGSVLIGAHCTTTCGASACAALRRVGKLDQDLHPIKSIFGATARQMLLCKLDLAFRGPPSGGGGRRRRPTTRSQRTWNAASYQHSLTDQGGGPQWSLVWESESFAADRWRTKKGSARDADLGSWPGVTGRLTTLTGAWISLPVAQHCAAWVRAYVKIDSWMSEGTVRACAKTWARDWGSECYGCP